MQMLSTLKTLEPENKNMLRINVLRECKAISEIKKYLNIQSDIKIKIQIR